jgi:hypothetical protein
MSKKLSFSLVPLVAIAAFAIMPVAAQASIHWYKNNSPQTAGKPIPVVNYGGAVNLSQKSAIGEINCRGVGGGIIENPLGGGNGVGKTYLSSFFECKNNEPEEGACGKARKENGIPLGLYAVTNAWQYGWTGALIEGTPNRTQIGEPWSGAFHKYGELGFKGSVETNGEPEPSPLHEIMARVSCETPPGFVPHIVGLAADFEGELSPEFVNGNPSSVKFTGPTSGALHSEKAGEGTNEGSVKIVGYTNQELITVH